MASKREPEPTPDLLATFRPESASPDDVENLIDYRVGRIDEEIKTHLAAVEDLRAERKRWLGVTGGRSRNGKDEQSICGLPIAGGPGTCVLPAGHRGGHEFESTTT